MAEVFAALGVVASVAQLADYGFKLSLKLYKFSSAVASADDTIKSISSDVSLTSTVLQELCLIIKNDDSHVVSARAVDATAQTVRECMTVFDQLNSALDKSMGNLGLDVDSGEKGEGRRVKRSTVTLERLKWPFKQPKMELLRSNLDRLKASLSLMLQVLSFARDVSSRKAAESSLVYQQHLIESMARSEREMKRRYHSLQNAIEFQNVDRGFNPMINTAVHIVGGPDLDHTPTQQSRTIPDAKPRILVGELLLSFHLLNDILGYHLASTKQNKRSSHGYNELRTILSEIHQAEMHRLKSEYDSTSEHAKAEALQSLRDRLGELARSGLLTKEEHNPSQSTKTKDGHESYRFDAEDESDLEAEVGLQALRVAEEEDNGDHLTKRKYTTPRRSSAFVDIDSEISGVSGEDEAEVESENTKGRRRRRKGRRNQFLDIEAEVSDVDETPHSVIFGDAGEAESSARRLRSKAGARNSSTCDESLYKTDGGGTSLDTSEIIDTSTDNPGGSSPAHAVYHPPPTSGASPKQPGSVSLAPIPMGRSSTLPIPTTNNSYTAAIQAEIDSTVALMRDNIDKVSQRGEKLHSIGNSDSLVNVVDLSVTAGEFRRHANRVQKQGHLWSTALEGMQKLGSEGYKAVKIASEGLVEGAGGLIEGAGALFENGRGLVTGRHEQDEEGNEDSNNHHGGTSVPERFSANLDIGNEEDEEDGDVVDKLLSAWTTLPPRKGENTAE